MKAKTPSESLTILTDLVLPGETNPLDSLFGGELLARMDRACSIAARRHSREIVVTASVNHVAFNKAVPVGSIITIEAKVSRAFHSSMEIFVDVWRECIETGNRETPLEQERYDAALRRKQLSLVLSKRMLPKDATALKKLFE